MRYVTVVPPRGVGCCVTPDMRVVVVKHSTVTASSHLAAVHSVEGVVLIYGGFVMGTVTCPRVAVEAFRGFLLCSLVHRSPSPMSEPARGGYETDEQGMQTDNKMSKYIAHHKS